jgi:hypothetical protein
MKTLEDLAQKYDNDKAVVKRDGTGHGYTPHYGRAFDPIRNDRLKVLEIGVASGPSIQMWLDYFPNAHVYGVDIVANTNEWNTVGAKTHERYTFVEGDQSQSVFWSRFLSGHGGDWDIIVDDGGHRNDQIITTFCSLWGALKPGGFYCIEDLGVCYTAGSIFVVAGLPNHSDFMKAKLDEVLQGKHNIDWMSLSKELAIIKKQ